MEYINDVTDFISNLSTEGLVLLITISICILLLIIITISLAVSNYRLRKVIDNERMISTPEPKKAELDWNNISINEPEEKKEEVVEQRVKKYIVEKEENEPIFKEENTKPVPIVDLEKTGLYERNTLRERGIKNQTSPIVIGKKVDSFRLKEDTKSDVQKLEPIDISSNEFDEDNYYEKVNTGRVSFVEEISQHLSQVAENIEELEDDTKELDDYEREQEENAVTSYAELLKSAEANELIDESDGEDDTFTFSSDSGDDFLNELKSFRNNL